nr:unnamed protein product [Callosobruchus analis]
MAADGGASIIRYTWRLEESAVTEEDDIILDRLKQLATEVLPEDWKMWRTGEIFGDAGDPQILHKIRFALPTFRMVRAFFQRPPI